jgi:hypothetical protein
MTFAAYKTQFKRRLRRNPHWVPPSFDPETVTVRELHEYKDRLRAWDAARMELGLATPQQIQRENSVGPAINSRILHFSRHG